MAQKEVYVEITKACWQHGVQQGVGSVVKMKESDAHLCIGLKRGKIVDSKTEKHVPYGPVKSEPKQEAKK